MEELILTTEEIEKDQKLAADLVDRLLTTEKEFWAGYWCEFNCWKFPMPFYNLMPDWYIQANGNVSMKRLSGIINQVMKRIKNEIGDKAISEYHNVFKGKMSPKEFEYWYDVIRPNLNDEWTSKYYERMWVIEDVEWWKDEVFEKLLIK